VISLHSYWLPGNAIEVIVVLVILIKESLHTRDGKLPHVAHWTLLDVSASMDVQIIINNEAAVIGSSLRKLT